MQLTQFTDYALRTLIYVALIKGNESCTIADIADSYKISKNHLVKVVYRLSQLGILKTTRGNKGGIQLNHNPAELNLGTLIQQIEPHFFIVECFDKQNGKCVISPACRLKNILAEAQNNFIETLKKYSLADIIQNQTELQKLLQKDFK